MVSPIASVLSPIVTNLVVFLVKSQRKRSEDKKLIEDIPRDDISDLRSGLLQ